MRWRISYASCDGLIADMRQIVSNAEIYNGRDSGLAQVTYRMASARPGSMADKWGWDTHTHLYIYVRISLYISREGASERERERPAEGMYCYLEIVVRVQDSTASSQLS